jgi:hypothetical protein
MRIVRILSLACAGIAMMPAQPVGAQVTRDVVLRLHKAGDTLSIRNASVLVDHTIEAGNTDSAGMVRIPDLEDGGHIVEAVAHGYQAFFDNFNSGPNIPQPIQLELLPVAPPEKVKGQATDLHFADFERRRARGQGKFFTRAQLEAASGRPLANLLQVDAGASVVSGPAGGSFAALDAQPSGSGPCYAAVVRDGVRLYPFEGAKPADLDTIFAEQLAAVEFYSRPAVVPVELKDAAACGALVIWTRDGVK